MRKLLCILAAVIATALPSFASAQVLGQNQVTQGPYGGIFYSTSSTATQKAGQLKGSAFGNLIYWDGSKWVTGATSTLALESTLTFSNGLTRTLNAVACDDATAAAKGCLTTALFSSFNSRLSTSTLSTLVAQGLTFSTTSTDYWKTQNNFFSTTSASYFSSLGLAFSTTSANAWSLVGLGFSTTSATHFVHSSTTIPKTYTANTWSALNIFSAGASTTMLSSNGPIFIGSTATSTIQGVANGTSTLQGFLNVLGTNSTSTFSGNVQVTGNLRVDGAFYAPVTIVSSGNTIINGTLQVTGQTTLASSLTGMLKGTSGVVSVATLGSDYINSGAIDTCGEFIAILAGTGTCGTPVFSVSPTVTGTFTFTNQTGAQSTSTTIAITGFASTSALTISDSRSGVLIGSATGRVSSVGVQTCTNQFVRAMSAAYVATCNTIVPADVDKTQTWDFGSASGFVIPQGSAPTVDATGEIALDTTNSQIVNYNGSAVMAHDPRRPISFGYSTTTAWTGSTTPFVIPMPYAMTFSSVQCKTDAGTLNVQVSYGQPATNLAMNPASTTMGTWTWTTSNTPPAATTTSITFGTPASSPTRIDCTVTGLVTRT